MSMTTNVNMSRVVVTLSLTSLQNRIQERSFTQLLVNWRKVIEFGECYLVFITVRYRLIFYPGVVEIGNDLFKSVMF